MEILKRPNDVLFGLGIAWICCLLGSGPANASPINSTTLNVERPLSPKDTDSLTEHCDVPRATSITLEQYADALSGGGCYAKALAQFKRVLMSSKARFGPKSLPTALGLSKVARTLVKLGRYNEAEPYYRRALKIVETVRGPAHPDVVAHLNNLALLLESLGHYGEAESLYRRALAITENAHGAENREVANRLNNLARLLETIGQYSDAEQLYRRALTITQNARDHTHPDVAVRLNNLATLLMRTGRYGETESLYRQTLGIIENTLAPDHPKIGIALNNLADVLRVNGHYDESETIYRRAMGIVEKNYGAKHPSLAISLNNLAGVLKIVGRYDEAESLYRRALVISEKTRGSAHPETGVYLNNLADLLQTTGRYAEAESTYRRALAIAEKSYGSEHSDVAPPLNNLALLLMNTGRNGEAEHLFRRALTITERAHGPGHRDVAIRLNNLATLLKTSGAHEEAERHFRQALTIIEKTLGPEHPDFGNSLNNLAELLELTGRGNEAETLFLRAFRIVRTSGQPRYTWKVQGNLMKHYRDTRPSNPSLAIFYGKLAVNTLQSVRGNLKSAEQAIQKSFLGTVEDTYQNLVDLLISEGRLAEAQQVLAMIKEEEFQDFIRRDASVDAPTTASDYTGPEIAWAAHYAEIGNSLATLGKAAAVLRKKRNRSHKEDAELAQLDADLVIANRAFDAAITNVVSTFADNKTRDLLRRDIETKGSAFKGTLKELGHDAVLVQYVVLPDKLHILLTTPTVLIAREAPIGEKALNSQIAAYRELLEHPSRDPHRQGRALYDFLVGPIAEDLRQAGAKTIMLSLDGVLRYLPFSALYDGERYLVEYMNFPIYTEAARDKLLIQPRSEWEVWGLGLTLAKAGFRALPGVRRELESIVGTAGLTGDIRLDEHFTAMSIKEGLEKEYPIIHLASHFEFAPGNETSSFLLLGTGDKLSLADIRHGFEFGGVELLTLSACKTAVGGGRDARGVEVEGMGVVAQSKGAKAVLATLWPVSDESTPVLMQRFYRQRLERKLTKSEALRQAQLALLNGNEDISSSDSAPSMENPNSERGARIIGHPEYDYVQNPKARYAHPYYWAPFILMGNWL